MRKKIMLICLVLLLLVGCKKIDNNDDYVGLILNSLNDKQMTNHVSSGYQYYVPKGVKEIHDYDYNQVFLIDKNYVYLYVDVISYFYERELVHDSNQSNYYNETFEYNNKKGYITIQKEEEETYFLSIVYHYSKIEAYVTEDDLSKVITLSSIILNSIDYNDVVIEKILEGDFGQFSEFTYEVDKPDGASSNFSQILEEYVQKDEEETEQLPDE